MKFQIKYISLIILILVSGLILVISANKETAIASNDAEAIVEHGHEGQGHEAEIKDEHEEKRHTAHDEHGESVLKLSPQALAEAGIVVEKLKPQRLSSILELPGVVIPHPAGEVFVGSLVEGRIKEILVDVGDRVSKGQALCVIESPVVGEAEAAYITAQAELQFISADLERHKTLVNEGIMSQKEQLELEASLSSSFSAVSAGETALHAYGFTQNDIDILKSNQHMGGRVTLRSSISGSVVDREARLGKQVTPESDLFHIIDINRLRIHVDIPEKHISDVSNGSEVFIVSQNDYHSELKGVIDRIGYNIDPVTRTLTAFATFDNSAGLLHPGAFVTVRFSLGNEKHAVLAVPNAAVFKDEYGNQAVFIEQKRGIFDIREIEVGRSVGGWTEIASGVSMGERVVTIGAFALKSEAEKHRFGDGHNH